VRSAGVAVAEGLDEHVLGRIVTAAQPVNPEAALFRAGRLGDHPGDLRLAIGTLG
jgi:hypothetical protein